MNDFIDVLTSVKTNYLRQFRRNSLIKSPQDDDPDESVKDLVEIALRKLDLDKDGKVSFQDYSTAVKNDGLLMEAFGQVLPTDSSADSFLSTLQ